MKDIFTDLYNKVLGFFRQTEKKEEENTKDVACNRLKFVLMQDRTNLSPELMDRMRKELVELLSKYVEMDKEALELGFEQEGSQMALMLSIPVVRAKEESEIEAILAKEDEEKAQKENNADKEAGSDDNTETSSDEELDENIETIAENTEDSENEEIDEDSEVTDETSATEDEIVSDSEETTEKIVDTKSDNDKKVKTSATK